MLIKEKLKNKGYRLPRRRSPTFNYLPVVVHNNLAYVSGQLPWDDTSSSLIKGKLGSELTVDIGQKAARRCVLSGLSVLLDAVGDLQIINRVVKISGFVASAPGFNKQPLVIDAASDLLVELFGENGRHARSAVGVCELPRGSAVEIEFLFSLLED